MEDSKMGMSITGPQKRSFGDDDVLERIHAQIDQLSEVATRLQQGQQTMEDRVHTLLQQLDQAKADLATAKYEANVEIQLLQTQLDGAKEAYRQACERWLALEANLEKLRAFARAVWIMWRTGKSVAALALEHGLAQKTEKGLEPTPLLTGEHP